MACISGVAWWCSSVCRHRQRLIEIVRTRRFSWSPRSKWQEQQRLCHHWFPDRAGYSLKVIFEWDRASRTFQSVPCYADLWRGFWEPWPPHRRRGPPEKDDKKTISWKLLSSNFHEIEVYISEIVRLFNRVHLITPMKQSL